MAQSITRELRLTRRHSASYLPSKAMMVQGIRAKEPVPPHEVYIPEEGVDWAAMKDHLATVSATIFGRYEMTVHDYRTVRRRLGLRVVFADHIEATLFYMAFR